MKVPQFTVLRYHEPAVNKLVYRITGDTWQHRDFLGKQGLLWGHPLGAPRSFVEQKAWFWTGDKLPDGVEDLFRKSNVTFAENASPFPTVKEPETHPEQQPAQPKGKGKYPVWEHRKRKLEQIAATEPESPKGESVSVPEQPAQPESVPDKMTGTEKPAHKAARRPRRRVVARKRNRRVRVKTAKPGEGFVKPSWWNVLIAYLTPGASRPAIAIIGPAGNGKTSAAKQALRAMNIKFVEIDANESLQVSDLIGGWTFVKDAEGAREVWKDGPITAAFRNGWAILINEFDSMNPRVAMCLQAALQDPESDGLGRYITLPGNVTESVVHPKAECPIIVTMNTYGNGSTRMYTGRNALDAATADRISIIPTGYESEVEILVAHGYNRSLAQKLVSWAQGIRAKIDREGLRVILGNRTLLRIAQGVQVYGWTQADAVQQEFYGRLEPEFASFLK